MICAKFGWNWSNGSGEEDENVKSLRQLDKIMYILKLYNVKGHSPTARTMIHVLPNCLHQPDAVADHLYIICHWNKMISLNKTSDSKDIKFLIVTKS